MTAISIYTDGGCNSKKSHKDYGKGGFGVVIVRDDNVLYETSGGETGSTNNRMELMGIITALETLAKYSKPVNVEIISDSKLALNTASEWIYKWKAEGRLESMKNPDLLKRMYKALHATHKVGHKIKYKWVKGHSGDKWNDRADKLAWEGKGL